MKRFKDLGRTSSLGMRGQDCAAPEMEGETLHQPPGLQDLGEKLFGREWRTLQPGKGPAPLGGEKLGNSRDCAD